jgi:hypothetical protein
VETTIGAQSEAEARAFLYCEEIMCKRIKLDSHILKDWGKSNARHILNAYRETRKHGFMIITAVHGAKRCELKCWKDERSGFSGTTSGNLGGIGFQVTPIVGAHFERGRENSGWISRPLSDDKEMVKALLKELL